MVVLVASGYGRPEFRKYGLQRLSIVLLGLMVWGLGWWTVRSVLSGLAINLGFLLVVVFSWGANLALGKVRWWYVTGFLAILAAIIRIYAPVATHQAQIMPVATIESLGLGVAAGLSESQPFPAAIIAASAEGLASVIVAWRHVHIHNLGHQDVAMVMVASMSAWVVGWLASQVATRWHRIA